ncbi:portal protein [Staphylococcus phage vB_SsapH-Golestan101-M]|nr:portal protein [Staphylococcus phage vB_SsapH-Golestan101-M]
MADFWKSLRLGGLKDGTENYDIELPEENLALNIREIEKNAKDNNINKSLNGNQKAYAEPFLTAFDTNPEYRDKSSYTKGEHNLHDVLKKFGSNPILNSVILTRQNQVSMYCQPARYSEKGLGFQVRMRDFNKEPGRQQKEEIKRIEEFLLNTGKDRDIDRDSFQNFCRKIVRDTYIFDQVNFEKIFNKKTNKLEKFIAVDPSTIFYGTNAKGEIIKGGQRYVQVIDKQVRAAFTSREMAMGIRNPRTDIGSSGYGLSEVEIAMRELIAFINTESFNDRFFSHGGTTRGVLQIKTGQQQSQRALQNFKREWKNSLSGINGSWQIPVVSAEDINFVNMTPTANDMQFEKWLNFLINIIASLYGIDPAEIGFPNKGGATGSKGGNTLNESDPQKKLQQSQNKGLQPLLRFIEDLINKHLVEEFGEQYLFQFVGGDTKSEEEKLDILTKEVSTFKTVNEARKERGHEPIEGGDIILKAEYIQGIGQDMNRERFEAEKEGLLGNDAPNKLDPSKQPLDGTDEDVNGRADEIGKDGQPKEDKAGYQKQTMDEE